MQATPFVEAAFARVSLRAGLAFDPDAFYGARSLAMLSAGVRLRAGGYQLSEERREGSGRASCYDPDFNLGRSTMSRPRDPGVPAGTPGSPSRQHPYTPHQKTRSAFAPLRANADTGPERLPGYIDISQRRRVGVRQEAKADLQASYRSTFKVPL